MVDEVTLRPDILGVCRLPPLRITPPALYDVFSNTDVLLWSSVDSTFQLQKIKYAV
jgi:hypothetical protein